MFCASALRTQCTRSINANQHGGYASNSLLIF
jgi:hypothetical protein